MSQVFISYSHEDDAHKQRVRDLALRLRQDKISILIDADPGPGGPPDGWPHWSEAQVLKADMVLLICTQTYCRRYQLDEVAGVGLGSVCEGRTIRQQLYDLGVVNPKFRAVLFSEEDNSNVPPGMQGYQRFLLYQPEGYHQLLAWLEGSAEHATAESSHVDIQWPPSVADYDYKLADRKQEFAIFKEILAGHSACRILLLAGASNTGKTVFLRELLAYAEHVGVRASLIDFKGCPSVDVLFDLLRSDLGGELLKRSSAAAGTARFYELMVDLQQLTKPVLLVFDTYEQASSDAQKWLEGQFLPRLDRAPAVIVVIGGQSVPAHKKYVWSGLTTSCELRAIQKLDDWLEYTRRRWNVPALTPAHVQALTLATSGDPGQLSALLEVVVERLQAESP